MHYAASSWDAEICGRLVDSKTPESINKMDKNGVIGVTGPDGEDR